MSTSPATSSPTITPAPELRSPETKKRSTESTKVQQLAQQLKDSLPLGQLSLPGMKKKKDDTRTADTEEGNSATEATTVKTHFLSHLSRAPGPQKRIPPSIGFAKTILAHQIDKPVQLSTSEKSPQEVAEPTADTLIASQLIKVETQEEGPINLSTTVPGEQFSEDFSDRDNDPLQFDIFSGVENGSFPFDIGGNSPKSPPFLSDGEQASAFDGSFFGDEELTHPSGAGNQIEEPSRPKGDGAQEEGPINLSTTVPGGQFPEDFSDGDNDSFPFGIGGNSPKSPPSLSNGEQASAFNQRLLVDNKRIYLSGAGNQIEEPSSSNDTSPKAQIIAPPTNQGNIQGVLQPDSASNEENGLPPNPPSSPRGDPPVKTPSCWENFFSALANIFLGLFGKGWLWGKES